MDILEQIQKMSSIFFYLGMSIIAIYGLFSFRKCFRPKQFEKIEFFIINNTDSFIDIYDDNRINDF